MNIWILFFEVHIPVMQATLTVHILLWILYYFLHSLMASNWAKKLVTGKKNLTRFYRLTYNVISFVGLVLLWIFSESQSGKPLFEIGLKPLWLGLIIVSILLMYIAFKPYSTAEFLGFDTLRNPEIFNKPGKLSVQGMNKWVRHPLYVTGALALIGYLLLNPHLNRIVYVGISLAYMWIGSRLEEKKLIDLYGTPYQEYLDKTPF